VRAGGCPRHAKGGVLMANIDGLLAEYVRNNESLIVSALEMYAEHMREMASSPGVVHSAGVFADSASTAERAARQLQELAEKE
jgi:hypothetical protein